MKKIFQGIIAAGFTGLAVLLITLSGCDTGITGHSASGGNDAIAALRSAASDPVVGCAVETVHDHDGVQYAGHYNKDGHTHNGECTADEKCAQTNCTETGLHQHNGTHYAGHSGGDGCGHHGQGQSFHE
ncbi:MAG: hypothetical protein LBK61_00075 [Spirochaetaceae bacterium]|jgi:hypothetical protein|nr:hypothetical protein [Spirochaetaceae bacterium]